MWKSVTQRIGRWPLKAGFIILLVLLVFDITAMIRAYGLSAHESLFAVIAYDPVLGWRLKPRAKTRMVDPEFSVTFETNSSGFRDRERGEKASPGVARILVIGDSFAEGWGVEEEESFPQQLEKILSPNCPVEVLSMAVHGYRADQEALLLERQGMGVHPHLVILVFKSRDVSTQDSMRQYSRPYAVLERNELRFEGIPVRPPLGNGPRATWIQNTQRVLRGSYLTRLVMRYAIRDPHVFSWLEERGIFRFLGRQTPYDEAAWPAVSRVLLRMARVVRDSGGKFLILWLSPSESYQERTVLLRMVAPFFVGNGIDFLELYADPRFASEERDLHFPVDGHLNRRGHRVTAEILAGKVARMLCGKRGKLLSPFDGHDREGRERQ